MTKEQKFYSILQDLFVGAKLDGDSGYVNLMNIKTDYFNKIRELIKKEVEAKFKGGEPEDLFDRLYTFFDSYFSEGGAIFFSSTPVYKNIYAKVYSDREDTALFWKTAKLYYVKSEANYKSIKDLSINSDPEVAFDFDFDASLLKHKKSNEKKDLEFYFIGSQKRKDKKIIKFRVLYKNDNKYSRLEEILKIKGRDKVIKYLLDKIETLKNPKITISNGGLEYTKLSDKGTKDKAKAEFIVSESKDLHDSVAIEPVISETKEIEKYLRLKGIVLSEEEITKAFKIYKKQTEIDYFIHKDAKGFLREQFDLYMYQHLANNMDTVFDQEALNREKKIKEIAYLAIEFIGNFEDELRKIWLKPKFARNSNYVVTLDRVAHKKNGIEAIKEIVKHNGIDAQITEWHELGIVEKKFDKKVIVKDGKLNKAFQYLPIDTKYFKNLEIVILGLFDNLDEELDGRLIKSENFQALNTLFPKYKEQVQTIYIDPPFNTGSDFEYIDTFQDSTWLTLMENRLSISRDFLKDSGSFYLHLDHNADYLGRELLNFTFGEDNFKNEIIWRIGWVSGYKTQVDAFVRNHDTIFFYGKDKAKTFFDKPNSKVPYFSFSKDSVEDETKSIIHKWKIDKDEIRNFKITIICQNGVVYKLGLDGKEGKYNIEDTWNCNEYEELNSNKIKRNANEYTPNGSEITQKPEELLFRIISLSSQPNDIILDFFSGSGTTVSIAKKLNRKFIGVEMGDYFYSDVLFRMKQTIGGIKVGISKLGLTDYQGGGFFKYYELEQYEDALKRAVYNPTDKDLVNIDFSLSEKQAASGLEIDLKKEKARFVFEKLYPDVDIAETISNLFGKKIKKITKDKVVFEDEFEVDLNNLDFEKYKSLKDLIYW